MPTLHRALIVVDVQQEYFEGPLTIQYPPPNDVLDAILATIKAAQTANIPVALIQHESPVGAAVFAAGSESQKLHASIDVMEDLPTFIKNKASVFTSRELTDWLNENQIDTITLVGLMANNCLLASAAAAESQDMAVEVLSDASGTINLSNDAGTAPAKQIHETLMTLLHSNWASVTDVESWVNSLDKATPLDRSNLIDSATT